MASDFIRDFIEADRAAGKNGGRVATRFPPEPNGYLHIGHAKAICLNFSIAKDFGGTCNLRFDDTNPVKEDVEYVESIQDDVKWLGFQWDAMFYASDYFERLYGFAVQLIEKAQDTEALARSVKDNGGGLDTARIRANRDAFTRAIARGNVTEVTRLLDENQIDVNEAFFQSDDDAVSYVRRLAQVRLDLVRAARARRSGAAAPSGDITGDLSSILSSHLVGGAARPPRPADDFSDHPMALELEQLNSDEYQQLIGDSY